MPSGPIYLPPHQFLSAAVLDFLVIVAWLLVIIFPPRIAVRRIVYAVLVFSTIAAAWYTPRHHVPAYSPPAQKASDVPPVSLVLSVHEGSMDEPWATIVGDILAAAKDSQWTWTCAHPHLRFLIDESDRWVFHARLAAAGKVLRTVGPQTIQIAINGVPVKSVRAGEAREYEVRFAVDPALIRKGMMNDVELSIAPAYLAEDGVRLGVLLSSIGFLEERDR